MVSMLAGTGANIAVTWGVGAATYGSIAPRASLLTFFSLTVGGLATVIAGSAYATNRWIETRVVMSNEDKEAFARKVERVFPDANEYDTEMGLKFCKLVWANTAAEAADRISVSQIMSMSDQDPGHGAVMSMSEKELMLATLQLMDVDGDDSITFSEFSIGCCSVLALFNLRDQFKALGEQAKQTGEMKKLSREHMDRLFACLDLDNSGFIEEIELRAFVSVIRKMGVLLFVADGGDGGVVPMSAEETAKVWFKQLDTDGDGRISMKEADALRNTVVLDKLIYSDSSIMAVAMGAPVAPEAVVSQPSQ